VVTTILVVGVVGAGVLQGEEILVAEGREATIGVDQIFPVADVVIIEAVEVDAVVFRQDSWFSCTPHQY
jgi:hypothetical protein